MFYTDGVPFPRNTKRNPGIFESEFATDLPSRVRDVLDRLLIENSKRTGVGQSDDISLIWFQRKKPVSQENSKDQNPSDSGGEEVLAKASSQ